MLFQEPLATGNDGFTALRNKLEGMETATNQFGALGGQHSPRLSPCALNSLRAKVESGQITKEEALATIESGLLSDGGALAYQRLPDGALLLSPTRTAELTTTTLYRQPETFYTVTERENDLKETNVNATQTSLLSTAESAPRHMGAQTSFPSTSHECSKCRLILAQFNALVDSLGGLVTNVYKNQPIDQKKKSVADLSLPYIAPVAHMHPKLGRLYEDLLRVDLAAASARSDSQSTISAAQRNSARPRVPAHPKASARPLIATVTTVEEHVDKHEEHHNHERGSTMTPSSAGQESSSKTTKVTRTSKGARKASSKKALSVSSESTTSTKSTTDSSSVSSTDSDSSTSSTASQMLGRYIVLRAPSNIAASASPPFKNVGSLKKGQTVNVLEVRTIKTMIRAKIPAGKDHPGGWVTIFDSQSGVVFLEKDGGKGNFEDWQHLTAAVPGSWQVRKAGLGAFSTFELGGQEVAKLSEGEKLWVAELRNLTGPKPRIRAKVRRTKAGKDIGWVTVVDLSSDNTPYLMPLDIQ